MKRTSFGGGLAKSKKKRMTMKRIAETEFLIDDLEKHLVW